MRHLRNFFQAVVMSILPYGCTTRPLTKCIEKKLDRNCTRMLPAMMNKSWKQYSTKQQLYGNSPPISKTIPVKRTGHAGHCWRSKTELKINVLQWIPTRGFASVGGPSKNLIGISSVQTQVVVWKTCRKRWMIGTDADRESRKYLLAA